MNVVKLSRLHGVMALASNGAPKDRNTLVLEIQDVWLRRFVRRSQSVLGVPFVTFRRF